LLFAYSTPIIYPDFKFHAIVRAQFGELRKIPRSMTMTELKIDGSHTEFLEFFAEADYNIPKWNDSFVEAVVGLNQKANTNCKTTITMDIGHFYKQYGVRTYPTFDKTVYYEVKCVPTIKYISAGSVSSVFADYTTENQVKKITGSIVGGQVLTIVGNGFDFNKTLTITINAVACKVISKERDDRLFKDTIKCLTGASAVTPTGIFKGTHGARHSMYSGTDLTVRSSRIASNLIVGNDHHKMVLRGDLNIPTTETSPHSLPDNSSAITSGFINVPKDGKYRFCMACSENCELHFVETSLSKTSPTKILTTSATQIRGFQYGLKADGTNSFCEATYRDLVAADYYYYEMIMMDNWNHDYAVLGIEYEESDAEAAAHPLNVKQIQNLQIKPPVSHNYETWILKSKDVSTDKYQLTLKGAATNTANVVAKDITNNASESTLYNLIVKYYNELSIPFSVTRVGLKVDGTTEVLSTAD
jgi:hypothetical protein